MTIPVYGSILTSLKRNISRKGKTMSKYIVTKGRQIVSETKVSKRTQKFVSCQWSSDPRNAQTYGIGDATDIAKKFGGTVEPYSAITRWYR